MPQLQFRLALAFLGGTGKDIRRAFQQLSLSLRDLVPVHVELLRQSGQAWTPFETAIASLALKAAE